MSPIKGLSDRGLAFPEIGKIRLGMKVKNAQGVEYPTDLTYFRVEFDESEGEAQQVFLNAYPGGQPKVMRVLLPYNELSRNWDAYYEAYTASRLVARSDGETILYWVNTKDGRTMVRDGKAVETIASDLYVMKDGQAVVAGAIRAEIGQPVPYVEGMVVGRDYQKKPVTFRVVGRLKVILPELQRYVYLTLTTGSKLGVINLGGVSLDPETGERVYSGELGAVAAICDEINGGRLQGVPFLLSRRMKEIRYKDGDKTKKTTKALLHIEADPSWVMAAMTRTRQLATPRVAGLLAGEIPLEVHEPITDAEIETDTEGDEPPFPWEEPEAATSETEPAVPAETGTFERPLDPGALVAYVRNMAEKLAKEKATPIDRQVVAAQLNALLGSDTRRYELCQWLVGAAKTEDMTSGEVQAILAWLEVHNFNDDPPGYVKAEAEAGHAEALIEAGQGKLF